jgi:hypothetical protein
MRIVESFTLNNLLRVDNPFNEIGNRTLVYWIGEQQSTSTNQNNFHHEGMVPKIDMTYIG